MQINPTIPFLYLVIIYDGLIFSIPNIHKKLVKPKEKFKIIIDMERSEMKTNISNSAV